MAENFIHTLIKIKYINEGYLPNYPYRMISDKEMFDAFTDDEGYFNYTYPCINPDLQNQYDELKQFIFDVIALYQDYNAEVQERVRNQFEKGFSIPDWIYSYLLGNTVSIHSPEASVQDLYDLLNLENETTEFTPELSQECYDVSKEWVLKLPAKYVNRPATMFGEPHVFKSLRLQSVNVLD